MKRRGFTLIELMVVIAIIIILAAIAIPNYLSMTARAKRSRVASDFAALATAFETYRTDWNEYPKQTTVGNITTAGGAAYIEVTGVGTTLKNSGTTAGGETAPITYMTENVLKSMVNPYSTATGDQYQYISDGTYWKLTTRTVVGADTKKVERTDTKTTLVDSASGS